MGRRSGSSSPRVVAAFVGLPLRSFGLCSLLYVVALARCFRSVRRVVVAVLGLRWVGVPATYPSFHFAAFALYFLTFAQGSSASVDPLSSFLPEQPDNSF